MGHHGAEQLTVITAFLDEAHASPNTAVAAANYPTTKRPDRPAWG
jgi:hypothetical protein